MSVLAQPITADQVSPEWIAIVREIVQREGRAVRYNPVDRTIEIKSLHDNTWGRLMLPTSVYEFASDADALPVFKQIVAS